MNEIWFVVDNRYRVLEGKAVVLSARRHGISEANGSVVVKVSGERMAVGVDLTRQASSGEVKTSIFWFSTELIEKHYDDIVSGSGCHIAI